MTDSGHANQILRRRLRRVGDGRLLDEVSGEVVTLDCLGASVADGERFVATDANGRDVTLSVLRDVAATLLAVTVPSAGRGGGAAAKMVSAITQAAIPAELLRRLGKRGR